MNKQSKKAIKIIIPLLLGIILVWYSLSQISINELLDYFKKADYYWVGLGIFFGLLSHVSRAYRWKYLIEPLGYKLRFPNSLMSVMSAYLINYTIPRAGEISRATIIANYEKVPFEKGFGTIVAERIADMLVMLCIILFTLFYQYEFIRDLLVKNFNPVTIIIGLIGLIIFGAIFFVLIAKAKSGIALKIKNFVQGIIEGATSIFRMKHKWSFIFHTLFIWGMYVLMFYVTSFSLEETTGIPFAAILLGFISASFSIAATNGGVGSYPVAVFAAFSLFNIAKEPSIGFGYIMWSSQTLLIIVLGGLSLIYLPIFNRRK